MKKKLFILILASLSLSLSAGRGADDARGVKKEREKMKVSRGYGKKDSKPSPTRNDHISGAQKRSDKQRRERDAFKMMGSLAAVNHDPALASPKKPGLAISPYGSPVKPMALTFDDEK